jgi:hypothetical protein
MTGNNCKIKLVWQFAPAKLGTSQLIGCGEEQRRALLERVTFSRISRVLSIAFK